MVINIGTKITLKTITFEIISLSVNSLPVFTESKDNFIIETKNIKNEPNAIHLNPETYPLIFEYKYEVIIHQLLHQLQKQFYQNLTKYQFL